MCIEYENIRAKDRFVVGMNKFVGIRILATRSSDDEVDGFPIYLEEEFEEDAIAFDSDSEVHANSEPNEKVQLIRENFAEIWIWQSSKMRLVPAWIG